MDIFVQQIINGLVLGSMYALVALGWHDGLRHHQPDQLRARRGAHGRRHGHWTVATFLLDTASPMPGWLIMLISAIAAIIVCAALNYSIEKIAYRPLRNAPRLAPLITAMGMSLLLQTLAMIIWKPNPKPHPQPLPVEVFFLWEDGPVITLTQVLILVITAVVLTGLLWLVNKTKLGRAMRATAENPRVAGPMGVRPDHIISATFHHRCGAGGHRRYHVGGQLRHAAAQHGLHVWPEGLHRGGVRRHRQPDRRDGRRCARPDRGAGRRLPGDLTGGLFGSHYVEIFAFLVLILVLTLRPSGLMGERVADRA